MQDLTGKAALITGAGQGVGLGIAKMYAKAGANLVITGRDAAKLENAATELRRQGGDVVIRAGDVAKRETAQAAVAAAAAAYGRLDVLVNNAQVTLPARPLEDSDEEEFRLTIDSGFGGTYLHMMAALPLLKVNGGSIINFGSREGIFGGIGHVLYGANKEGIRGLSRGAAREWGKYKIRVNVICPAALSPGAIKYFSENPEQEAFFLKEIALGYFGDPEQDIGPVALFLASDDSRYVTGQTLNVDGGQMML
jgi:NAD(P)-dependent dehydrogenase (short-subunit alcohol dehydrogenase family)